MAAQYGFIGAGEIAEAIIIGLLESKYCEPSDIAACSRSGHSRSGALERAGVSVAADSAAVLKSSDIIFLCLRKREAEELLKQSGRLISEECLLISVVGGLALADLQRSVRCACTAAMPNLAVRVGKGVTAYCTDGHDDYSEMDVFSALGLALPVSEEQLAAVIGASASGIALIWHLTAALVEKLVVHGFEYDAAVQIIGQTLSGAGEIILQSGEEPDELCGRVATEGGKTEAGLAALGQSGARQSLGGAFDAVIRH